MLWFSNQTWILFATVAALLWVYLRRRLSFLQKLGFKDSGSGFLGLKNFWLFSRNPDYMVYEFDIEKRKKYGDVYGIYTFLSATVVVWDTDILKEILIKKFNIFPDRQKTLLKIQGKELNNGLLGISGSQWKRVRSTLSPTFSTSKLRIMLPIVQKCGEKFVERLTTIIDEKEGVFDLKQVLGRFTMNVICSSALHGNMDLQTGETEPEVNRVMSRALSRNTFADPRVALLFIFPWLESFYEKMDYSMFGTEIKHYMRRFMEPLMKSDHLSKRHDMLQMMLESEISENEAKNATKGMTRIEIAGNSQLMVLAGYDTVSTALLFLLYNLATHQHVQDRLREEVYASMDRNNGELGYEAINDNDYMTMCINESMRLYPNAPLNQRFCDKDVTIKGYRFAKGVLVRVPVYGLAHDETYWSEPFSFKPERMEDMSEIDPFYHQPFGQGPRNCIGMRFALMVLKFTVSTLLTNFELQTADTTPKPPLKMTFTATAGPKEKIQLKVKPLSV